MEIVELILDDTDDESGVYAISVVSDPAIESNFIALSKEYDIKFEKVDEEKRILRGPALIPNKTIFRKQGDRSYYVYFSKDTIRKTSEMFFKAKAQDKSTLEHELALQGLTVVESWIVEDAEKDKSRIHNMKVPEGTWMISMKVENDEVWNDFVKTGKVKGFSIEGYFSERMNEEKVEEEITQSKDEITIEALKSLLSKYEKAKH